MEIISESYEHDLENSYLKAHNGLSVIYNLFTVFYDYGLLCFGTHLSLSMFTCIRLHLPAMDSCC